MKPVRRRLGLAVVALALIVTAGGSARAQDPLAAWRSPPIDFSSAGYRGGGAALPILQPVLMVQPGPGDDTDRVMAGLSLIEARTPDADGHRGVLLLAPGRFEIGGRLRIGASGVVLRGSGSGPNGTILIATGQARDALISVGRGHLPTLDMADAVAIRADVPAGARELVLAPDHGLSVGDAVVVQRPSTAEWITRLGMDAFVGWRPEGRLNWKPGSRDIVWDRRVTAVSSARVTLDAPLTTALTSVDGGGLIKRGVSVGRLREIGVEGLRLVSEPMSDRPNDEDHSWFAVAFDGVEDAWVRDVAADGFVSYVVDLGPTSRRVTVQDVSASDPVSEIGGMRRRVFYTAGQQTLFVRCRSEDGIHDFGVGHAAAGPNVFLDCFAEDALGDSGTLESWASGVLFDGVKVRGGGLNLMHRGRDGQGVGWSAANSVLWNCEATEVAVMNPPGASNAAIGCRGELSGDGILEDPRVQPGRDFHRAAPQEPASLYRAQLEQRLGASALAALEPWSAPVAPSELPVVSAADVSAWRAATARRVGSHPLTVANGEFSIDGQPAWRRRVGFSFFQAQMPPALAPVVGPAITRFAPGLHGRGLTDDLDEMAAALQTGDVIQHNYGLWYDRRRIDHDFYGSPDQRDGEVWAPFMELPWARSGEGRAWDGLSKYDLTRFNPWFFDRIQTFADRAEERGVVMYHRLYFQHWLLESRSHYVDFPWRPANALQDTGLPNEVPAAEVFWDVSDPVRRDLHRQYIRHTLDTLKGRPNVVFGLDPEYTGPLSFVQFWLDEIAAWERENDTSVHIAVEAPKAVVDGILDDADRAKLVDAVGFHHWVYRPDGSLFAVQGGLNKAPREQVDAIARPADLAEGADAAQVRRVLWASTPAMRYRAFREYRDRDPDLVVLGGEDAFPDLSRAVARAVPAEARAQLRPDDRIAATTSSWGLSDNEGAVLIYSIEGQPVNLAGPSGRGLWIGETEVVEAAIGGGRATPPAALSGRPWALWVRP